MSRKTLPDLSLESDPSVDFFVIGAQKSGTRALASFLKQNPDIGMSKPSRQEPHYFDKLGMNAPNPDNSRYHTHFTHESLAKTTGDSTPSYIFYPHAIPAIHRYNPNAKLIALLRNPADRAYSQWNMQVETGKEVRDFVSALGNEAKYCRAGKYHRNFSYVRRGFYYKQISHIFSVFPRNQCLILRNEEMRDNHSTTMDRVFQFLNVRPIEELTREIVHSRSYSPMPKTAKRALKRIFRKDIESLEGLLGWDCSAWK